MPGEIASKSGVTRATASTQNGEPETHANLVTSRVAGPVKEPRFEKRGSLPYADHVLDSGYGASSLFHQQPIVLFADNKGP